MEKLTVDDVAEFTYCWGWTFFLETPKGNYEWSDPAYNGNNTIRPFAGTLKEFCDTIHVPFCRFKGKHVIKDYCGSDVKIVS